MVFIEACESGSLFQNFDLKSLNIWALTATNATGPSYGTFCFPHDKVLGQNVYSCLGDMFSVSWMDFIEQNQKQLGHKTLEFFY